MKLKEKKSSKSKKNESENIVLIQEKENLSTQQNSRSSTESRSTSKTSSGSSGPIKNAQAQSQSSKDQKLVQSDWLKKQQDAFREFEEAQRLKSASSRASVVPIPVSVSSQDIPSEFLCPISQAIMSDPVMTSSGNCYERSSIQQWLQTKNTDPLTNLPLESKTLIPNRPLRTLIEQFVASSSSK